MCKVIVKANPETNQVITLSNNGQPSPKDGKQYGYIILRYGSLSTLVKGDIEVLKQFNLKPDQELPGKLYIKQSTTPFRPNQKPVIDKFSGKEYLVNNQLVYQEIFYDQSETKEDELLVEKQLDSGTTKQERERDIEIKGIIFSIHQNFIYNSINFQLTDSRRVYIPLRDFMKINFPIDLLPILTGSSIKITYYDKDEIMASGQFAKRKGVLVKNITLTYNQKLDLFISEYISQPFKINDIVIRKLPISDTLVENMMRIDGIRFLKENNSIYYETTNIQQKSESFKLLPVDVPLAKASDEETRVFYNALGEFTQKQQFWQQDADEQRKFEEQSFRDAFEDDADLMYSHLNY